MTRRRDLLGCIGAGAVASVGGCMDSVANVVGSTDDPAGTTIVDVDPDPAPDLPVTPDVSISDAEETEVSPPTILVRWENDGRDLVRVGERRALLFDHRRSVDGDAYLLGLEGVDREEPVSFDACWRVTGTVADDGEYGTTQLGRRGKHTAMAGLYADADRCLESETYRFETPVTVWNPDEADVDAKTERWGFELQIETGADT